MYHKNKKKGITKFISRGSNSVKNMYIYAMHTQNSNMNI